MCLILFVYLVISFSQVLFDWFQLTPALLPSADPILVAEEDEDLWILPPQLTRQDNTRTLSNTSPLNQTDDLVSDHENEDSVPAPASPSLLHRNDVLYERLFAHVLRVKFQQA